MTILSKQYPMDLTTGSIEQVRQSAPKIDNELTSIYGHLNSIRTRYRSATAPLNPEAGQLWEDTANNKVMKWTGSAWVQDIGVSINLTNRNTVLQGAVDGSGNPALIAGDASDLTADLVATTETIIATPAGHDATVGNLDYIVSFSATQTDFWTSLPANNTSYLFVDYASGTVTGTYSVIAPVYQTYAPAHSAGLNWYDTNKEQWYLSDGSNWVAKYRCYVGYVVTDGTKVTATTNEPYNRIRKDIVGNVTGNVTGNLTGNLTGDVTGNLTGNVTTPDGALSPFLGRNKIINGNFAINQRAVSGTVVLTAGQYGHDRWKAGASGCTYTFATVENVTTITITAGSLLQIIEGLNLFSGTHILTWQGTAQGKIGAGSYSASGITGIVTGGTNLNIEFGTGTLKLVQFEQGSVATPFESRNIGQELALCQRYFYSTGLVQGAVVGIGQAFSASAGGYCMTIPAQMRVTPTPAFSIIYGTDAGGTNRLFTGMTLTGVLRTNVYLSGTGASNLVSGNGSLLVVGATGSAGSISFNAEL